MYQISVHMHVVLRLYKCSPTSSSDTDLDWRAVVSVKLLSITKLVACSSSRNNVVFDHLCKYNVTVN